MNTPGADEVEVANEDEIVCVFPPNATTKGQNDRRRKGNMDDLHAESKCALYPYRRTFCSGEKDGNEENLNLESEGEEGEDSESSYSSPTNGVFDAKTARILIAKMIIIDKLPLKFVKDEGFRRFMEQTVCAFAPEFVIPSPATVARDILGIYQSEKQSLRNIILNLGHRVSLTIDTWTSDQDINYMVLTGHFIDLEWKVQRRILNFRQIENHGGETVGREVEKCLKQWGVEKILTLTVDNASSNDTTISYLVNRFKKELVLDGNFVHVRCFAHILNLIVCGVMEDFHELISKVRNAVRFVRSSSAGYSSFEKCIEEENLSSKSVVCLDVPNRWDHTYMMLEGAVKFAQAFERLRIHDMTYLNEDIPTSRDWEVVRTLVHFLSLFYKATLRLSSSFHVTSNRVFHEISTLQNCIKNNSLKSDNLVLNDIAMKVQAKYDKYWWNSESTNYLLYVPMVLDPRYKMKFLSYCFRKLFEADVAKEMCKKVEDILRQLFKEYSLSIDNNDSPSPSMTHHSITRKCSATDAREDTLDDFDYGRDYIMDFYHAMEEDKNLDVATEVDIYLLERLVDQEKDFDILKWWKNNCLRYKVLGKIAQEMLAIPVSTIASESAFNIRGRVIDSVCFTSAPNLVEVLACVQNWLNEDAVSIDLHEHIKDIIRIEEDFETSLKEASTMAEGRTMLHEENIIRMEEA